MTIWGLSNSVFLHHRLSEASVAVKGHSDHDNSYKGKHLIGSGLQFKGLVHYHHGWKQTSRHGAGEMCIPDIESEISGLGISFIC